MGDTYSAFFLLKKKKKKKVEECAIAEKNVFLFMSIVKCHSNERKSFDGDQFDATNICSGLLNAKQKLHCSRYPEEFWPHMKTNYKLLYTALS